MKKIKNTISVNGKKYEYTLKENKKNNLVYVECDGAKIAQDFLKEDIANLILNLPNLILAEKEYSKKTSEVIQFRVTPKTKRDIEKKALKEGFDSVSSYIRKQILSF